MAIQFVSIKCPECGADLRVEDDRQQFFCTYCGAKVMMTNDSEKIIRQIDEARMKEAETDRMVKMKKLEMAQNTTWSKKPVLIMWMILTAFLLIMSAVGFVKDNEDMALPFMIFGILSAMCLITVTFARDLSALDEKEKKSEGKRTRKHL